MYPMPSGNAFHYLQILCPPTLKMEAACLSETCALNVCVCIYIFIFIYLFLGWLVLVVTTDTARLGLR